MKTWFDLSESERQQALKDERAAKAAAQAAFIADSPNRIAREKAEREAAKATEIADKEVAFKQSVLASYIEANGSEQGFAEQWPTFRAEIIRQRTVANVGNVAVTGDVVDRYIARMNAQ